MSVGGGKEQMEEGRWKKEEKGVGGNWSEK
jgi:hypothetical protein